MTMMDCSGGSIDGCGVAFGSLSEMIVEKNSKGILGPAIVGFVFLQVLGFEIQRCVGELRVRLRGNGA